MKDEKALAKYRIRDEGTTKTLELLGAQPRTYEIMLNGNSCKIITSKMYGVVQLSAGIKLKTGVARLPTWDELLVIKENFFEKNEYVVFGISKNILMNYIVMNPAAIHLHEYEGEIPPVDKILAIDTYKVDGRYKIARGSYGGWRYVKIFDNTPQLLVEIEALKEKYAPGRDVAILLLKDAVIMWSNHNGEIRYHHQTLR